MGYLTKGEGWMVYHLYIDGREKPRRIYWRNHNRSYIKMNGTWVRVYFYSYILDTGPYSQIPMRLNPEGEWEMVHEYMELPDRSYVVKATESAG